MLISKGVRLNQSIGLVMSLVFGTQGGLATPWSSRLFFLTKTIGRGRTTTSSNTWGALEEHSIL
ncbi:MAG: hypothetical protein WA131_00485 [Desulfitobacteriaceae bacterium]